MTRFITLALVLMLFSCNQGNSQQTKSENNAVQGEDIAEDQATFKYGESALQQFIIKTLVIPFSAMRYGVNGKVDVEFMIDETGKVASVRTLKSNYTLSKGLNSEEVEDINFKQQFAMEAERVIWLTDTLWNPAQKFEKSIASSQVITFDFKSKQFAENNDRFEKNQPLEFGIFTAGYIDPSAQNHYQLGVKLLLDGIFDEAGKHLSHSLQLKPNNRDAWFNLALCYRKLGKQQEACEAWQRAAELGDNEAVQILSQYCN